MKTDTYLGQQELYFYAICALFPDRISTKPHTTDQLDEFIPHYFESDEQAGVLDQLKSRKLLDYRRTRNSEGVTEFVIDDINSGKFTDYLHEYLEKFRNDELLGDASNKPESYKLLQKRLHAYLSDSTRNEPLINPTNIWPDWIAGAMQQRPFLEIILTSDMLDRNTQTLDVGISSAVNAAGGDISIPFAKIAILNPAVINAGKESDTKRYAAELEIRNFGNSERRLILKLEHGAEFIFQKSLRTDMPPHSLMKHLIANPGKEIAIDYVRTKLDGCESVKSLSETVRDCEFDKPLKDLFFDEMSKNTVRLKQNVYVTMNELNESKKFKSGRIVPLSL